MIEFTELEKSSPHDAHAELVTKKLEIELLKFALNKIFKEKAFSPSIEVETLNWELKQIFSFEIKINKKDENNFSFLIKDGVENIILDFNINGYK